LVGFHLFWMRHAGLLGNGLHRPPVPVHRELPN